MSTEMRGRLRVQALVTGDRAVDEALARLAKATQGKVVRQALRAGAKVVQRVAVSLAPVGGRARTKAARARAKVHGRAGVLKRAVKIRSSKTKRPGEQRLNVLILDREKILAHSRNQFWYPAAVEYGRRPKGRGLKADRRGAAAKAVPGRHWFRAALNQADSAVKAATISAIKSGIDRAITESRTP